MEIKSNNNWNSFSAFAKQKKIPAELVSVRYMWSRSLESQSLSITWWFNIRYLNTNVMQSPETLKTIDIAAMLVSQTNEIIKILSGESRQMSAYIMDDAIFLLHKKYLCFTCFQKFINLITLEDQLFLQ